MSKPVTTSTWTDPDDAPELSDAWFRQAEQNEDGRLVKRGRPPLETKKQLVSLRLDPDVIARFKADGPGWQARINETLRKAVGL
ncbi:BrnA antitoxin family protein [Segnochrobactrum spirostomi]|uniref:BrnA antitoxin family protein n=1 Tax=Segnochrobactrum spirostomi TaxID=2608987 RepID=A0A6A7Y486_9HYPH|nr:BrnA antitoxin family protein [Segnochrobactrum spirostomi]MQT13536.1 BrnA antitoxin family protein [Segnochrobactrum spirostomi]